MLSDRKKIIPWLLYLPVALLLAYYTNIECSSNAFVNINYLIFLLLAVIIAIFPIRTDDSVFTLITGVSLTVFVVYGMIPQMVLTSVAFLSVMIRADIRWDQHYRYALNLFMVSVQSFLSATAYNMVAQAGPINIGNPYHFVPLIVYMLVNVFTNQLFIYITHKYYYEMDDVTFFNRMLIFTLRTAFITLPLSFILISFYRVMGSHGIVIGALPFITVTVMMKYYYRGKHNNAILTQVNHYSQKLTSKMTIDNVIKSFCKYLLKVFPGSNVAYFELVDDSNVVLKQIYHLDESIDLHNEKLALKDNHTLKDSIDKQKITSFTNAGEWEIFFSEDVDFEAESIIIFPVHILSQNKGIIVLAHQHRAVYDDFLISLIEVFYQYFRAVLDNAIGFEAIEMISKTDYLTNLPNLRGFNNKIKEILAEEPYNSLSIVIMDLDHFKHINDRHGHEAGNDILKQVSDLIKSFENDNIFAARYGGEEFIILLKDYGREGTYAFAEKIRKAIESEIFHPRYSIAEGDEAEISITASLGVATYPEDTDDIYDLISKADRVMYLKSKRNGRNRVAEFIKES